MLRNLKLVCVGDGAVAKTSLLHCLVHGYIDQEYIPTVFDNYNKMLTHAGEHFNLNLFDSAGQEDYASLRALSYPHTDIVLICFSVISPTSFQNVSERWIDEIRHYLPGVTTVLVGTKTDLRTRPDILKRLQQIHQTPITFEQGQALARSLNMPYIECSPLHNDNVEAVFHTAVAEYLKSKESQPRQRRKTCQLL